MASDIAAFPMLGAVLRIWQVDLALVSSFEVSSLLFKVAVRGRVLQSCVKILGGFLVVICFIPRVFLVKSCIVLPG
jgi:hypothetical protein